MDRLTELEAKVAKIREISEITIENYEKFLEKEVFPKTYDEIMEDEWLCDLLARRSLRYLFARIIIDILDKQPPKGENE